MACKNIVARMAADVLTVNTKKNGAKTQVRLSVDLFFAQKTVKSLLSTLLRASSLKIMIFGGMGFVGSHLTENLVHAGHDAIVLSRGDSKFRNIAAVASQIKIEYGDIANPDWVKSTIIKHRPEAIYHFAGQLTTYESFEKPLYDLDVNSRSTLVMLETIREHLRECRFILGSTFWVVGKPPSLPVDENTPCRPLNIYAADRFLSENYCSIYNSVYDLDTLVVRFTNTFGPREQHDNKRKAALNYLIYKALKGEEITIYDRGEFYRDYMYVTDAASAAETVLERGKSGETYFIGTGKATWFYDIGKWLEELTDGKVVYIEPPDFHKRINVGNFLVNNKKISGLGWDWKVSVRDGIIATLDYYREMEREKNVQTQNNVAKADT